MAGISGIGLETANWWYLQIPAAAEREKLVAAALMCVYSKPHIPDRECREGHRAGKGRDVGSQMKSFIG